MSEPWMGLHNPERHEPDMLGAIARCATCGDTGGLCHPDSPCRCCLAAEVEVLRAQVQRVRELCTDVPGACQCGKCWVPIDARDILRILDGGDA